MYILYNIYIYREIRITDPHNQSQPTTSPFLLEERETSSLLRGESVSLRHREEAESFSIKKRDRFSSIYREERDSFSIERRECLSSL